MMYFVSVVMCMHLPQGLVQISVGEHKSKPLQVLSWSPATLEAC